MRWGKWFLDGESVVNIDSKLRAAARDLRNPPSVVRFIIANPMTSDDAAHLIIAANELAWRAFNFERVGDWIGEDRMQKGAAA